MAIPRAEPTVDDVLDDLDWDVEPPTVPSGVVPASTVRPEFDMTAYARESEERLAVADFVRPPGLPSVGLDGPESPRRRAR